MVSHNTLSDSGIEAIRGICLITIFLALWKSIFSCICLIWLVRALKPLSIWFMFQTWSITCECASWWVKAFSKLLFLQNHSNYHGFSNEICLASKSSIWKSCLNMKKNANLWFMKIMKFLNNDIPTIWMAGKICNHPVENNLVWKYETYAIPYPVSNNFRLSRYVTIMMMKPISEITYKYSF